jgi:hypothetical protein
MLNLKVQIPPLKKTNRTECETDPLHITGDRRRQAKAWRAKQKSAAPRPARHWQERSDAAIRPPSGRGRRNGDDFVLPNLQFGSGEYKHL